MPENRRRRAPASGFLFMLLAALLVHGHPAWAAGSADSIWGADYFPNVELTTHEGKKVHFFDDLIKDKVVAINFIFTRCPDACPLETARLREVQKIFGDRAGKDIFIYSISIDPEYDTPEVLKKYAERFEIGPGWLFLTGKKDEITLLRKKLGVYDEDTEAGGDLSAHSLSLVIGNQKTGRWMKGSPFENPYILATQLGSWLHNWKMPPRQGHDYADAPQLRTMSTGESLFRTRCSACHTIGETDVKRTGKKPLGPDLTNINKKRERDWLIRIIAEPDKLLEEKDPLALALLAEYNNVRMPNLRLNAVEIEALLTYIDEESNRLGHKKLHGEVHHKRDAHKHDGHEHGAHQHDAHKN